MYTKKLLNKRFAITVLFIGNSATYVNDIPHMLESLANSAGYNISVKAMTERGYELAQHANIETEHGKRIWSEIDCGYDIVFLQDHSDCISSNAKRKAAQKACEILCQAICSSGGKPYMFVRPPSGKLHEGYTPLEQSIEFDKLFCDISFQLGIKNAYVNRAFAYAIQNYSIALWEVDNTHTSKLGAYLAVCVLFSTLFHISSTILDTGGLSTMEAHILQEISDKIVLDGLLPW